MNYESHAEKLQSDDNKARYEARNIHRKELVEKLFQLLNIGVDSGTILRSLNELGFKTDKDFANKNTAQIRKSVIEAISHLEELSSGVLQVTNTVDEDTTKIDKIPFEHK